MSEKKKYELYLPDIGHRHFIGSSQGFLISIDNIVNLHATNPITGTHIPLPPTSNSPGITGVVTDPETGHITHYIEKHPSWMQLGVDYGPTPVSNRRDYHYRKVVLSPSMDIAVAIYGIGQLACARIGDNKWTALYAGDIMGFYDANFHKGRLHAITYEGTIAIFDDLDSGMSTFISPKGPLSSDALPLRYLIESPDGKDLVLVYRELEEEEEDNDKLIPITVDMVVFLLDKATYTWKQMITLGDIALFLGFNHSMSLCTREYPGLKRNSVYFTDDNKFAYSNEPELAGDMGVFNLEDGSIEPIYVDNDLDRFGWPPPIWFKSFMMKLDFLV